MSRLTAMRTAALAAGTIAALIAGPGAGRASAAGCANASAAVADVARTTAAAAVRCLVNAERAKRGLPTLAPNARLRVAATAHSVDMVRRRFFDHVSPGGSTPVARVRRAGYTGPTVGEAIGWGTDGLGTPAAIVRAWMNSPPHRFVLLHPRVREVGVGVALGTPFDPDGRGAVYTLEVGRR